MTKRGQAVLEFMFTYGWAILAVAITIATLVYFGVIRAERFIPEYCITETGVICDGYAVYDTGHVFLETSNYLGQPMNDVIVSLKDRNGNTICVLEGASTIQPGEKVLYATNVDDPINTNCIFEAGEIVDLGVAIDYTTQALDTSITRQISGDLVATVLPGPPDGEDLISQGGNCGDGTCDADESCNSCPDDCGSCVFGPVCGDGNLDPGEGCDDGNTNNGDGCSSSCTIEQQQTTICGNGIIESGEICELGDSRLCTTSAGYPGSQTCNSQCDGWNTCTSNLRCGDGICTGPPESCSTCPTDCGTCPITCTDQCSPAGAQRCSGTRGYQTCGNYDADTCLEWSTVRSCLAGTACVNGVCTA